jgi:DNA modification methylase
MQREILKDIPLTQVKPYDKNYQDHKNNINHIANSIKDFGYNKVSITVDEDMVMLTGHGTLGALEKLEYKDVPLVLQITGLTANQKKAFRIADNESSKAVGINDDFLKLELDDIGLDFNMEDYGLDLNLDNITEEPAEEPVPLNDVFLIPPFSILDTKQGRKKNWKRIINDNAQARKEAKTFSQTIKMGDKIMAFDGDGVSILDPVLAEVLVKWFCPEKGLTIDPFSGDTVFGFVSAYTGNTFEGTELRREQAEFNQTTCDKFGLNAKYYCDDGRNVGQHVASDSADMLFSCPPYFDLEKYSDDPNDASNQSNYADFLSIIDTAFTNSIKCLKDNRFATIVITDIRDKNGFYYDMCGDIKNIFKREGMPLYNELILANAIGTACLRASRYMVNRKIAKVHQNVLVFYKGNPKDIKTHFPKLEVHVESTDVQSSDMD